MPNASNGPSTVAVVGAVTGVVALLWNILRSAREGPRLHVSFYVFHEDTPDRKGPGASITIVNAGTLPAYISGVGTTKRLPWTGRGPMRALPNRLRNRWWLRWALLRTHYTLKRQRTEPDLLGPLQPGELKQGRLVDIINDAPVPMSSSKVEDVVRERPWAVVETGLRSYAARIVDNRG